jgi:hypothetical protein
VWLPPLKELHYFNIVHLNHAKDEDTGLTRLDENRVEHTLRQIEWVLRTKKSPIEKVRRINLISLIGTRALNDEWYGSIFRAAPEESVCGEITPDYALLTADGIQHILRLQPDTKFLFLLRDPIERGWSELRMLRHREQNATFNELQRIRSREFFERADYGATIERFRCFVAPNNFLVLHFDDIVERPLDLLDRVCRFIGVDVARARFKRPNEPVHQGNSEAMSPDIYRAMRGALKPAYDRLLMTGEPMYRSWASRHFAESHV